MSDIDTRSATLSIKKYFILIAAIVIINASILFFLIGLEWYTYVSQNAELAAEREDDRREAARDLAFQKEVEENRQRNAETAARDRNATLEARERSSQFQNYVQNSTEFIVGSVLADRAEDNEYRNVTDLAIQEILGEIRGVVGAVNATVVEQAAKEANLTREEQESLLTDLEVAFNTTIPELAKQSKDMLNATNEMLDFIKFITESFDEEYLIDEVRQYGQSNATFGNLTSIQDKLDELLKGNSTLR